MTTKNYERGPDWFVFKLRVLFNDPLDMWTEFLLRSSMLFHKARSGKVSKSLARIAAVLRLRKVRSLAYWVGNSILQCFTSHGAGAALTAKQRRVGLARAGDA